MKKRLAPILTICIAVVLIGSIAYAADRKKNVKQHLPPNDPVHEEEALRAELLEAVDDHEKKIKETVVIRKAVANRPDVKKDRHNN